MILIPDGELFISLEGKKNPVIQDSLGYTYNLTHKSRSGDNISWRCSKKLRGSGCKAYVVTSGAFIIKRKHQHACVI